MSRSIFHCTTGQGEHTESLWQPNMLPFIGVMLALVMVLLTGVPGKSVVVPFVLGMSPHGCRLDFSVVKLAIDFDGSLLWQDKRVSVEELQSIVKNMADDPVVDPDLQTPVCVSPSSMSNYASTMMVLNILKNYDITNICLVGDESSLK